MSTVSFPPFDQRIRYITVWDGEDNYHVHRPGEEILYAVYESKMKAVMIFDYSPDGDFLTYIRERIPLEGLRRVTIGYVQRVPSVVITEEGVQQ